MSIFQIYDCTVFLSFSYLFQFVDCLPALRDARDEVGGGRAAEVVPDLADEVAGGDEAGHLGMGFTLSSSLSHSGNVGTHMLFCSLALSKREREGGERPFYIQTNTTPNSLVNHM